MPALASPSTWRTHRRVEQIFAYLLNPDIVLQCSVAQSVFFDPVEVVFFDNVTAGSYSNVRIGQTVVVESSTGVYKGKMFVRKAAVDGALYIQPASAGEVNLADNDILKVLDLFEPHIKKPRILPDGSVFKNYDLAFTSAAASQPPVADPGPWYAKRLNGAASVSVSLSGSNSFAIEDGATITTYLWDIEDGTVTSGTINSATLTVTFPDGYRWISLTVTDSNGQTHTAYKLIVTTDNYNQMKIGTLTGSLSEGWECQATLLAADASDYPRGTALIVWAEEQRGATAGSLNGVSGYEHIKFAGWTRHEITGIEPYRSTFEVNALNMQGFMDLLVGFPQTTVYSASPTSWWDVANHNAWRHIHHIVYWHSNFFELTSTERPTWWDDFPAVELDASGPTLREQINFIANGVRAKFAVDRTGRAYFRFNPHLMTEAERNALTITVTLANTDWKERVDIQIEHIPKINSLAGSGVVASSSDITAKLSAAPGTMPAYAGGQEALDAQLIEDQDDLNNRTGRQYALLNIDTPQIPLQIINGGMIADPAWQEWIEFTQAASTNKRAIDYNEQRFVLDSLTVSYQHERLTSSEEWTLHKTPSDTAPAGVTVVVPGQDPPAEGDYIDTGGTWDEQDPYDWDDLILDEYVPDVVETPTSDNETVEVVTFGSVSGSKVHHTPDWTAGGGSPTWTQRAAPSTNIQHLLPALNSRQAVYAVLPGALWYSANVASTNLANLSLGAFGMDAYLMRMNSVGQLIIFGDDGTDTAVRVYNGASLSSLVAIDTYAGEASGDVDDFGLGLVVVPSNLRLWFALSYTGTFTQMTGLTGVTGLSPAHITMVRIPYRRVSGALNNNLAAMEVIYSIYRSSLHRVTYNFLTNSVVSTTAITPTIGGNPAGCLSLPDSASTVVSNGTNFETYAGDARRMMGSFRNSAGTSDLLKSSDGGATWTSLGLPSNVAHQVHFVEPERGGNGRKCWAITVLDIYRTDDFWDTYETITDAGYTSGVINRGIFQL